MAANFVSIGSQLILFFVLDADALQCHACAGQDGCKTLVTQTPHLSGKCDVTPGFGKCFIRRDPNDEIYWGCIDEAFWPGVPWRTVNGCVRDAERGWVHKGQRRDIVWCFCDHDDCNVSIEHLNVTASSSAGTYPIEPQNNDERGETDNSLSSQSGCESSGKPVCQHLCDVTSGRVQCSCISGYLLAEDAVSCVDINECTELNGGCEGSCINTLGSYNCKCHPGLELMTDGHTCSDLDECSADNGGCEQICENVFGAYHCGCRIGYTLNPDRHTCDADALCAKNGGRGDCEHSCIITLHGAVCHCRPGYRINADGRTCSDVDECSELGLSGCQHVCHNAPGTYHCHCHTGFTLDVDGRNCNDVDECSTGEAECGEVCVNTVGSYRCDCYTGSKQRPDNRTCTRICPQDFQASDELSSCYKVFTPKWKHGALSWDDATRTCQGYHRAAHLIAIETSDERQHIANILKNQPMMVEGWQGWWTSGRHFSSEGSFAWVSPNMTLITDDNPHWGFKKYPEEKTCVWVMQLAQYDHRLGNYDCRTRTGFICEIEYSAALNEF